MRPFSSTSIWNMPIGSNAHYVPAGLPYAGAMGLDKMLLRRLSALDPTRPLIRPGAWRNRCSGTISTGVSMSIPDTWIVPDAYQRPDGSWNTPNNTAALLMPDGRTLLNTNAVARCTTGGPIFGWQTGNPAIDRTDLYGDGRLGSHGGSKLSGIGGAIRPGELSGGAPIRHALDLLVWGKHLHWGGDGFRWPAVAADSYASTTYTGTNAELQMGSLLAIPPWVTAAQVGITTTVGTALFTAMQDYGGYVTDDSGWDANYLSVDEAAAGTFAWGAAEQADMKRIIQASHVVANNAPATIGGGGTPRQPLLPELVPPGADAPATTAAPATTTAAPTTTTAPSTTTVSTTTTAPATTTAPPTTTVATTSTTTSPTTTTVPGRTKRPKPPRSDKSLKWAIVRSDAQLAMP
jgi:hypothetical protein